MVQIPSNVLNFLLLLFAESNRLRFVKFEKRHIKEATNYTQHKLINSAAG